jgi:CheY-like chemotaxis protein
MATVPSTEVPAATPLVGSVLYVEDDPINFALVEALLSAHPGVNLVQARTGEEGVDRARFDRPDAILLDMHLPDMSGIEVVRRLSIEIAAGTFRVTLLTADRLNIDVLKAMSLGAFEYLPKPADLPALEAALGRALSAKAQRAPVGRRAAAHEG